MESLSVRDSLQAATGFQILLLFTVILMCLNPSGGEVCTACQAGASAATPPGVWKEARGAWSHYRSQEIGSGAAVRGG